ncbi:hypothetical protein CEP52_011208 [Fusarium oligoseptatum]|uniref:Uncharacterized protein n=1 Tax=Fusarium oligoseptatum TaxID=2604345 RepID=A0A428T4D8_9HYPO|nr:hypothetical protein CEP52_011208 [Fusarium oligoseptatum]
MGDKSKPEPKKPQPEASGPNPEEPPQKPSDKDSRPQAPARGQLWRPGRSEANREINLGLKRKQQAQELQAGPSRQTPDTAGKTHEGSSSASKRVRVERDESPAETQTTRVPVPTPAPPRRTRRPIPPDWKPPLAVGASLGDNLSRIEEAERSVLQWEAILENARETQPLADLSSFEKQLEKVRAKFNEMENSEENSVPVDQLESTKREKVQERIRLLKYTLERNECPTANINIRAAIKAYEEETIRYWDIWALFYAGHLVDLCYSYDSFTHDRAERLDRYYEQHGPGWLWYEPPLAPTAGNQPSLMAATWAQPAKDSNGLSGGTPLAWDITMGFRRVKGFHSRDGTAPTQTGKFLAYKTRIRSMPKPHVRDDCWVEDDESAARCFFLMQLDSGATHPCLYNTDLDIIGIDRKVYPPQTHTHVNTANSSTLASIYEMRVDVCRHDGQSLVGDNPVWPEERRELGGIVPVMILLEGIEPDDGPLNEEEVKLRRERGQDVSEAALAKRKKNPKDARLSGMLPFQVCYFAGAPGMDIWFGEDRRDVLGADRMPGQRRWERHKVKQLVRGSQLDPLEERPVVTFDHKMDHKRIVDTDVAGRPGASQITVDIWADRNTYGMEPRVSQKVQLVNREKVKKRPGSPTGGNKKKKKRWL